ncbi:MAG: response regulator [Anaerolineales bacterium]
MTQTEMFFRNLFDLTPTPTAIFNFTGKCLLTNRAFSGQIGMQNDNLLEAEFLFTDIFDKSRNARKFLDALDDRGVIRRWEMQIKDREGRSFPVLISGRILDYQGQKAFEVSFTDISRQKRLQQAIRRGHARMTSLIESISEGLFLVDRNGMVTELNFALTSLLDISEKKLVDQPYRELFAHLLESAIEPEVGQQSLKTAVLNVTERPVVELVLTKHDQLQHLEITFFPVWEEEGLPIGWGGLVRDITRRKEQIAWKLELLSILSHDIRTPLATLKGHATALLANYQYWGNEMVKEFLESIDRGIDNLVHQVDRNLALTRVESGQLGLRPQAVKPKDLVIHAVERAGGALGGIEIEVDISDTLPNVRVDAGRVEEVLVNLLENAARFSPADMPITISAAQEANWISFSVIDRGPGVSQDNRHRIFEKYARSESEGEGTGLGLFISRKIIEAHGGRIWVESPVDEENQGAEFVFTLPLMPVRSKEEVQPEQVSSRRTEVSVKEERVLIVEDEPDFQALLRTILTREGYQVEVAPDGPTALELVQSSTPDLVLLDWVLPGMDGISVCRNLRRISNIPIMIVTSKTAQEDLIAALDAGADDYVTKPFHGDELLARIRALLRRSEIWVLEREGDRFSSDGLLINFENREVHYHGELLELTPTEYELLAYLVRHARMTLSHGQLIEHLWGLGGKGTRRALFVHISRLRQKLEDDPKNPELIVTRWGVGYSFMPR